MSFVQVLDAKVKEKKFFLGVYYYSEMFGHLHKNPSTYSSSLTTITCGHPVKVSKFIGRKKSKNNQWAEVRLGGRTGYVKTRYLLKKRLKCFQDIYPKFFENFNLDLAELFYWGKLHDQFIQGKSRVK